MKVLNLLLVLCACAFFPSRSTAEGRRLEVLFLGDNAGHKPAERFPFLYRSLGPKGIDLTYTDRLEDLNDTTLGHYDLLAIYAKSGQLV